MSDRTTTDGGPGQTRSSGRRADDRDRGRDRARGEDRDSVRSDAGGQAARLQRAVGNQGVHQLADAHGDEQSLPVGPDDDPLEREARRVARAVTPSDGSQREAISSVGGGGSAPSLRGNSQTAAPDRVRRQLQDGQAPGRPLPRSLRRDFASRLGGDLGGVRIHDGGRAARLSSALDARAFTLGRDIYFGGGHYRPETAGGRRLLAHELAHTIQGDTAIRRENGDAAAETDDAATDPVLELGRHLWAEFPYGVNVAFYEHTNSEARLKGTQWAASERALGVEQGAVTAENLTFGEAFSDSRNVTGTIQQLEGVLSTAADRAASETTSPSGASPDKIRNLALFSHGFTDKVTIGTGIKIDPADWERYTSAASFVSNIADAVAPDVNVIFYACSAARSPSEARSWRKHTMEGGGQGSLAGTVRDKLLEAGKAESTVWSHAASGHVTRNFVLRYFRASTGAGSPGISYAGEVVFGTAERAMAVLDLRQTIQRKGYEIPEKQRSSFNDLAYAKLKRLMYSAYAEANPRGKEAENIQDRFTYQGRHLAETAPVHPLETRERILTYWRDTFWPQKREALADELIQRLDLPEVATESESGDAAGAATETGGAGGAAAGDD